MKHLKKSIQESLRDTANTKTAKATIICIILLFATSLALVTLLMIIIPPITAEITATLLVFFIIYSYIAYHITKKNTKTTKKKSTFTKFTLTFTITTLLALAPLIIPASHTINTIKTYSIKTASEPLKEQLISSIITGTLNPIIPVSILLWFLLFYTPFILLIENTTIAASAKKSIKLTTEHPKKIALSIIISNILFLIPLLIASIPFLLTTAPVTILIPNQLIAPVSLITIIPSIIISTIISFSFLIHYYQNALQKT